MQFADEERRPFLSVEAAATLVAGLVVGLIPEMQWWLRALGVLGTCLLAIHTGKRIERPLLLRIAFPALTIGILVAGTWHTIWLGFHETFPTVTEESTLSKIIEFCAVTTSGIAGYFFLVRPRSIRGYRVLPAQVIAFGMSLMAIGLLTAGVGLAWQFRQNWNAGTAPGGAPVFTLVPPQIPQTTPPLALPPPNPTTPTPFFDNYNLTEGGVIAFANELYAIRDAISKRVDVGRMGTDGSAGGLVSNIGRACDRAGIECPVANFHPNTPDERGIMIYVLSPDKPPEPATKLQAALLKIGLNVPFVARPEFDPNRMALFIGPRP
jgi:hypothetical protein